jgi:lipoprotein-releasing system permease protein
LAGALGLVVGDRASLQVFVEPDGLKSTPVRIDGIYESGFAELDERWVFTSLPDLQARVPSLAPSAIEVFLVDPEEAEAFRERVESICSRSALVTTWQESNRSLFAALRWQKLSLALVLSLVVGVGAFEVASALVVLVTEKRRDIGILLALGGAPPLIREVLLVAGWAMGAVGVVAGLAIGLLVVQLMGWLGQPHFSPEIASIYMIDRIPFVVRGADLGLVALVGLVEVLIAAAIPAARAASREPVEVLRWV